MADETVGSDRFWELIDLAQKDRQKLRELLKTLPREEVYAFQDEFLEAAAELQDEPYVDHMEPSEDGIQDISEWIVSQGRDVFVRAIREPGTIPFSAQGHSTEILSGVAPEVYRERFGEPLRIL